ncbi:S1 family peptidase [Streptomyces sp. DSM 41972]|uniref:S1 family peptidase n=1 Tax=Streptomyces althioticus subsp. attaecolombicae TaxID=3075534 RepID=A0ABU3HWZ2_9ACTN|nr:S1 family peptidase [Streptomyces sp. DSM 41972]SCD97184.1 streptogrisin B [Streptomyces sp. di50b]SCE25543.1 streptogrisin B [Streptomyces sp. di188]
MPRHSERTPRSALRNTLRALVVLALFLGWSAAAGPAAHADQPSGPRAGQLAPFEVRGGDFLYAPGVQCVVGFNATNGGWRYGLLASQCAQGVSIWYMDPALTVRAGVPVASSLPGGPTTIRYANGALHPGEVSLGPGAGNLDITGAANPVLGQSVCHASPVSGVHCGGVIAVNQTVNWGGVVMNGLFRSSICSDPWDIGSPAFSGGTALGTIVANVGTCASGGHTLYRPVTQWLSPYGLNIY